MERRGFILIADITGFTSYLSGSEIEHAQGTITDLLGVLVDQTRAPLVVSQLEGDAVMSYAFGDGFVSGQALLESLEDTYLEFRRAIELMVLNNTCQCNACANVSTLDLKFLVHFGSFVVQPVGGFEQLLGSDVNLIHRLLKNSVRSETGIGAYLLCTEPAAEALGLDPHSQVMVKHRETVPDFGEIEVYVKDMHPMYEERRHQDQYTYSTDDVLLGVTTEIALSPELVWDYLIQPEFRAFLLDSDRQEVLNRKDGRVGPGSIYQCYHGDKVVSHQVVEWIPFERILVRQEIPFMAWTIDSFMDWRLTLTEEGTRLDQTTAAPALSRLQRKFGRAIARMARTQSQRGLDLFRERIQEDRAARETTVSPIQISVDQIALAAAASLHGDPEEAPAPD